MKRAVRIHIPQSPSVGLVRSYMRIAQFAVLYYCCSCRSIGEAALANSDNIFQGKSAGRSANHSSY